MLGSVLGTLNYNYLKSSQQSLGVVTPVLNQSGDQRPSELCVMLTFTRKKGQRAGIQIPGMSDSNNSCSFHYTTLPNYILLRIC